MAIRLPTQNNVSTANRSARSEHFPMEVCTNENQQLHRMHIDPNSHKTSSERASHIQAQGGIRGIYPCCNSAAMAEPCERRLSGRVVGIFNVCPTSTR